MHRKILIIRFSSIGDLVLTTPVIRCLKNQFDAEIHLIVKSKFKEVLHSNPHITKTWTIEKSTSEIIDELRKESYDLVIDLHNNIRSILLTWQLRKPYLRFHKLNIRKWLLTTLRINVLPQKHLVDRYFDSFQKIELKNDGGGLDFFIDQSEAIPILQMKLPEKYIVGVLGATYFTKQIPYNKWQEIIRLLDKTIVLIGGTPEQETGAKLKEEFPLQVIDLTGRLNLQQSAIVISNSEKVITPDTGMMHIAAALRKPMHVLWGNTIPQFGMYPYYGKEQGNYKSHEVHGLSCRPCTKLGYHECPLGHFNCMQKQILDNQTLQS